jgi:AcrR family transcriptional regulator
VGADAIVQGACQLLAERAPSEITLALVATTLRIDRSLIRYYFQNRSNLMLSLARHLYSKLKMEFQQAMEGASEDPDIRLQLTFRAMLRFQLKHPYFHRLLMDEVADSKDVAAVSFMRSITSDGLAHYQRLSESAAKRPGLARFDPVFLYIALIGMTELFATSTPFLRVAYGDHARPEEVAQQYEKFMSAFISGGVRKRGR